MTLQYAAMILIMYVCSSWNIHTLEYIWNRNRILKEQKYSEFQDPSCLYPRFIQYLDIFMRGST